MQCQTRRVNPGKGRSLGTCTGMGGALGLFNFVYNSLSWEIKHAWGVTHWSKSLWLVMQ